MYKKIIKYLIYVVVLLSLFLPFVFSQAPQEQSMSEVINKVMQSSKKDIVEDVNKNMDEDIAQLDSRLVSKMEVLFRKAIFALTGSLAVVIFGYAFVTNRLNKRYDINFYEKMMDSKIEKLNRLPYIVTGSTSFYTSVTRSQFDERYTSPEKYFERFTESDQIKELKKQVEELQKQLGVKKGEETGKEQLKDRKIQKFKRYRMVLIVIGVIVLLLITYLVITHYFEVMKNTLYNFLYSYTKSGGT